MSGSGENGAAPASSPGFEGPEKGLEIDFAPDWGPARGLREITRAQWDGILTEAACTILATLSNDRLDSYVLSESSLFVYPLKMLLKTCGTTTLLKAIGPLLAATEVRGGNTRGPSHFVIYALQLHLTRPRPPAPPRSVPQALGMKVEWVAYTRKNFNFPEVQKFPHRDPQEEVRRGTRS